MKEERVLMTHYLRIIKQITKNDSVYQYTKMNKTKLLNYFLIGLSIYEFQRINYQNHFYQTQVTKNI